MASLTAVYSARASCNVVFDAGELLMELNTMSVHALSERVENLEQQLAAAEAKKQEAFEHANRHLRERMRAQEELERVRSFAELVARPGSEPLNSITFYRGQEDRRVMMAELRGIARAALASPAAEPVVPEALCWVLWYHQGANSPIGQSIRQVLGMTRFQRMSDKQVEAAKAWAAENPWLQQAQPAPATEPDKILMPKECTSAIHHAIMRHLYKGVSRCGGPEAMYADIVAAVQPAPVAQSQEGEQ